MLYEDLTLYPHSDTLDLDKAYNVGWLSDTMDFPTGTPPDLFLEKLLRICGHPINVRRSLHVCPICKMRKDEYAKHYKHTALNLVGSVADILVKGKDAAYVSPVQIYHYIADHKYLPPEYFIKSVLEN